MLTLLLLRHARAEPHGSTDIARELSPRGWEQASGVGRDLRERGLLPDVVLCSNAVRTLQTWAAVEAELAGHVPTGVHIKEEFYRSSPDLIAEWVLQTGREDAVILVVGHEPIMSMTAAQYAGADSDLTALMGVRSGMPTAAYALIELPEPSAATGDLRELVRSAQ